MLHPDTKYNTPYKQWLTLFDSTDDDEFDGVLGDDDEEFPKILCTITIIQEECLSSMNRSHGSGSVFEMSPGSKCGLIN